MHNLLIGIVRKGGPQHAIYTILRHYELGDFSHCELIQSGYENSNILIQTNEKR